MPETAMHEYHFPAAWEYQVRAAEEIPPMKPVTVSQAVRYLANHDFRRHILAADRTHVRAAPLRRNLIHCQISV